MGKRRSRTRGRRVGARGLYHERATPTCRPCALTRRDRRITEPAQEKPWTEKLWIYDLRTNKHFTLKENTLKRSDLDDFVACYFGEVGSARRADRTPQRIVPTRHD